MRNPELQFGWVTLLLCGYLVWEGWEKKPAARLEWTGGNVVIGLVGLTVLFLTQLYQAALGMTPASMSGLGAGVLLVIIANLNYAFGSAGVRHFGFAAAFILLSLPPPAVLSTPIVTGLQSAVATINVEVLNLLGIPAHKLGSVIQLPNCNVGVDDACSGIRSLQSTIMATLFIGHLTLRRNSFRAVLFLSGIALAIAGNLARSLFLSFSAHAGGVEAIHAYHDAAGWSILIFTATGVVLLSWWLDKLERSLHKQNPTATAESRPAKNA